MRCLSDSDIIKIGMDLFCFWGVFEEKEKMSWLNVEGEAMESTSDGAAAIKIKNGKVEKEEDD